MTLDDLSAALGVARGRLAELAAGLNVDQPLPEEEDNPLAYARRVRDIVRLKRDVPVAVCGGVRALLDEVASYNWSAEWFTREAHMRAFGLNREAVAYRYAALWAAEPVADLSALGLYEAAWYKASDAIHYAGVYLNVADALVALADA